MAIVSNLEDGTQSFESELHEVLSSWIAYKEAIPKRWKKDVNPINPMSYNDLQTFGLTGCTRLISRARKSAKLLTSLSDTLRDLSFIIQAESKAAQENFEAVANMCSLLFLPNEILTHIFQFVVNGEPKSTHSTRSKAAFTLSHVSQVFRSTALHCASLWTDICGKSGIDILSLSRSKDRKLDVATVVNVTRGGDSEELEVEQSLIDALNHSERWRSLDIRFMAKRAPVRQQPDLMLNRNSNLRQAFRETDVRSLETLRITNTNNDFAMFNDYDEFQLWNTPNLRCLESFQYFPLSLPGLANLTRLDVTLKPGQLHLADFHRDLSCMKKLEYLSLKVDNPLYAYGELRLFQTLELPAVRHLNIEMETQRQIWIDIFEPFFYSMAFPNAVDLYVKLSGFIEKGYREDDEAFHVLYREMETIVQHNAQFPLVEHFYLEANDKNIRTTTTAFFKRTQQSKISVSIPLQLFPNVKHLTLRSNTCLCPHQLATPSGNLLGNPALETITVQVTNSPAKEVAAFVEHLFTQQTECGEWEEFRELIVEDNRLGDEVKKITKVYAGDDAVEWCKRRRDGTTADENIID
ncbi:hypothetical protein SCHPADRAFT_993796 [Schizopora paradoxa]|uniref:Uncharacterized protein n=1 Tax=Schizopora paradoxa TaxID=27342 RepID=A0A0H2S1I5_9AGAM|nr:hypothetical protein SCHPADRAFT_993796 [Schizopora paradoxa]